MAPENEGRDVFDRNIELLRQEKTEPSAVQHAGHPDDAVVRQAASIPQNAYHNVQRVCNADYKGLWAVLLNAVTDLAHHISVDADQIVAAHTRFARHAGGDDNDVGIA